MLCRKPGSKRWIRKRSSYGRSRKTSTWSWSRTEAVLFKTSVPEDLTNAGLGADQAFDLAANNLAKALQQGDFQIGIAVLADGVEIGCARGNWMAPAGGLVIGNFHAMLSEHFGGSQFVAVAINQQCLFAFPKSEVTLASFSLRRAIEDEYEGSHKPISRSWLLLDGTWPRAFPGRSSF